MKEDQVEHQEENKESYVSEDCDEQVQLMTFTLGEEEYGVDIMCVKEIRAWNDTTRLPNSEKHMRGVINLRGIVIPIFDLRMRFNMKKTEATSTNVVIIIRLPDRTVGVLVDAVSDILTLKESDIKAAPAMETGVDSTFVIGIVSIEKRMVVVLDIEKIFDRGTSKKTQKTINS